MIDAMATVMIILVALAVIMNLTYVAKLVLRDGGSRPSRRTPPRSHLGDGFEPPQRFA
jgi:hypothetical protein